MSDKFTGEPSNVIVNYNAAKLRHDLSSAGTEFANVLDAAPPAEQDIQKYSPTTVAGTYHTSPNKLFAYSPPGGLDVVTELRSLALHAYVAQLELAREAEHRARSNRRQQVLADQTALRILATLSARSSGVVLHELSHTIDQPTELVHRHTDLVGAAVLLAAADLITRDPSGASLVLTAAGKSFVAQHRKTLTDYVTIPPDSKPQEGGELPVSKIEHDIHPKLRGGLFRSLVDLYVDSTPDSVEAFDSLARARIRCNLKQADGPAPYATFAGRQFYGVDAITQLGQQLRSYTDRAGESIRRIAAAGNMVDHELRDWVLLQTEREIERTRAALAKMQEEMNNTAASE
jgi:hypothetical protein